MIVWSPTFFSPAGRSPYSTGGGGPCWLVCGWGHAQECAAYYRNIALADATVVMAQIPSLDDVALGVSLLATRGVEAVIATVSWSFAAAALANLWGFTRVRGVDLEVDDATGRFTGLRPQRRTAGPHGQVPLDPRLEAYSSGGPGLTTGARVVPVSERLWPMSARTSELPKEAHPIG